MRPLWHYPPSTFCDAIESADGWVLVMFGTSLLGLWLGLWIGLGELPGRGWVVSGVGVLIVALLLSPHLLILYGVTGLLW